MKNLCIILLFGFVATTTYADIVITVGDSTFDFQSIDSAIFEAHKNPDATTIILIEPGIYDGFRIDEYLSPSKIGSLLITSRTNDSADVKIKSTGGYGAVYLVNCQNIKIENITLSSKLSESALQILRSENIEISKCNMKTDEYGNTSYTLGTVNIEGKSLGTDTTLIVLNNCTIGGLGNGLSVKGGRSVIQLKKCKLLQKGRYGLTGINAGVLLIDSCFIMKELSIDASLADAIISNSSFVGNGNLRFSKVVNCTFKNSKFGYALRSHLIENCEFKCGMNLSHINILKNNICQKPVELSGDYGAIVRGNIFKERVGIKSLNNATIVRNEFRNRLSISTIINDRVALFANNTVVGYVSFNLVKLYHNNFIGGVFISDKNSQVKGNIFQGSFYGDCMVEKNNYWPTISAFDEKPYNFDPKFISDSILVAQNHLLAGIIEINKDVEDDFYGNNRRANTSIGAHEICIELDSFYVECGQPFSLQQCNTSIDSGFHWVNLRTDEKYSELNPTIALFENTEFALTLNNDSVLRTVSVTVKPPKLYGFSDTTIDCGFNYNLYTSYFPLAAYNWTPGSMTADSTVYNPIINPLRSTMFSVEIDLNECGIFYDSILVEVDREPLAIAYPSFVNDSSIRFSSYHPCADSVLWDFGDGNFSKESTLTHVYEKNGDYLVLFKSFIDSLVATDSLMIYIRTDVKNMELYEYSVYPNPTKDLVYLPNQVLGKNCVLQLYDSNGRLLERSINPSKVLQMPAKPGVYLLRITNNNGEAYFETIVKN